MSWLTHLTRSVLPLLLLGCDGAPSAPPDAAPTMDALVMDASPDATSPDASPDAAPVVDAAVPDAASDAAVDATLSPLACQDGQDNDQDGLTDFPEDLGCAAPEDGDEADPPALACENRQDDDGDGLVDFPDDPGCAEALDPAENNQCGAQTWVDLSATGLYRGTTAGRPAVFSACRENRSPEAVFSFTLRQPVDRLVFDTIGSGFDTLLAVRDRCDQAEGERCNDDQSPQIRTSQVVLTAPPLGEYFAVVDGYASAQGPFVLNVRGELARGAVCPPTGPLVCGAGDTCRDGRCALSRCADGEDNDQDGLTDYPQEPGCASAEDDDEANPAALPQCADREDNDQDGAVDFPADEHCLSAADDRESPDPPCSNGRDDDGDGLVDLADPGCVGNPDRYTEYNPEACRNGQDDNGDGLTDYPQDPGCTAPNDPEEQRPEPLPACADHIDNDEDGLTDYPDDAQSCLAAADDTEDDACARRTPEDITGRRLVRGTLEAQANDLPASCTGGTTGPEHWLVWQVYPERPLSSLILSTRGTEYDATLTVRETCGAPELSCDDNSGVSGAAILRTGPLAVGESRLIALDSVAPDSAGIYRLEVVAEVAAGGRCDPPTGPWRCAEGLSCRAEGEVSFCREAVCSNGLDDDGDGLIDYPDEPGCADAGDDSEADPSPLPQCANGLDDDGDGLVDLAQDPRCTAAGDDSEGPDCANGVDDDGDLAIDFDRDLDGFRDPSADDGCACAADETEDRQPACGDGCDNDRDGRIDLDDSACAGDLTRNDEYSAPQCANDWDDDQDGLTDYPNDSGCRELADPLEDNPLVAPACADRQDNDQDGLTDFGDDPGCLAASDDDERTACEALTLALPESGDLTATNAAKAMSTPAAASPKMAPSAWCAPPFLTPPGSR